MNSNKEIIKIWKEKKAEFERELAISSNPSLKFELKQRILECERQLQRLNNEYETEDQLSEVSNKEYDYTNFEKKTKNLDISPDEWFSKKRKSRLSKFLQSLFDDK